MGNMIKVGMADLNVCRYPDNLTTLGLGSCIGACIYDPVTKIIGAGGAQMFAVSSGTGANASMKVGEKNAESAKVNFKKLGIRIIAEDTGLNYGRTIEFYSADGSLLIKAVGKELKRI